MAGELLCEEAVKCIKRFSLDLSIDRHGWWFVSHRPTRSDASAAYANDAVSCWVQKAIKSLLNDYEWTHSDLIELKRMEAWARGQSGTEAAAGKSAGSYSTAAGGVNSDTQDSRVDLNRSWFDDDRR